MREKIKDGMKFSVIGAMKIRLYLKGKNLDNLFIQKYHLHSWRHIYWTFYD